MSLEKRIVDNEENLKKTYLMLNAFVKHNNELNTLKFKNDFPEIDEKIIEMNNFHQIYINEEHDVALCFNNSMEVDTLSLQHLMTFDKYGVEVKYCFIEKSFFVIIEECKKFGIDETLAKNPNTFKLYRNDETDNLQRIEDKENPYYVITTNRKTAVAQEEPDGNYRMVDVSLTLYYAIYKKDMAKLIKILDDTRNLM